MTSIANILTHLTQYFSIEHEIPAWILDTDDLWLHKELETIARLGCFRLKAPKQYGGLECSEEEYHHFKQAIVQYSGALAFLQHQHQGAIRTISSSHNEALKQFYMPQLITGELLVGVGISQLRQKNNASLRGIKTKGGYQVTGYIPWASGYKHFKEIIIGFVFAENEAALAIIPFRNKNSLKFGKFISSKPLQLIVAQSTNTVNIHMDNYFIADKQIVLYKSGGNFSAIDFTSLNLCSFHIGLAKAALNLIRTFVGAKYNSLENFIHAAEHEISTYTKTITNDLTERNFTHFIALRTQGIRLSNRLIQLACTLYKGQSILQANPAQRLYRESLLFNSFGASDELVESVFGKILESGPVNIKTQTTTKG